MLYVKTVKCSFSTKAPLCCCTTTQGGFCVLLQRSLRLKLFSKNFLTFGDNFIFINRDGQVQHQGTLNKALRRIIRDCNEEVLEKYGIESDPVLLPHFSCHILRHTFATRLCESGVNIKVIQDVLGHADIETTMNIYIDVTKELKKKEIAAFGSYIEGERQSTISACEKAL